MSDERRDAMLDAQDRHFAELSTRHLQDLMKVVVCRHAEWITASNRLFDAQRKLMAELEKGTHDDDDDEYVPF